MNPFQSPLAKYVRVHRKRTALSQEEVAFLLGIGSSANVSCHERFLREPSLETAMAYQFIFQTPIRGLFAGKSRRVEREIRKRVRILVERLENQRQTPATERKLGQLRIMLAAR